MWNDYLFKFANEDSDNYGEYFFVELFEEEFGDMQKEAIKYALDLFPDEEIAYCGQYYPDEADALGFDTY